MKILCAIALLLPASSAFAGQPKTTAAVAGLWRPQDLAFAHVIAQSQTILSLPFAARIVSLTVQPGTRVAAGETLARFDAPVLKRHLASWSQARRELTIARDRLTVTRQAEQNRAVTRRVLLDGKQAVAQAEGRVRMTWQTLAADFDILNVSADAKPLAQKMATLGLRKVAGGLSRLRAPFAGVVRTRRAAQGEQLIAGAPILELEAVDRVYLDVGVPEKALSRWRGGESRWHVGSKVIVLKRLDTAPRYDATTSLWLLRFAAENPDGRLQDGQWVQVTHRAAPRAVVWVPAAAVVARNGKSWCIVAEGATTSPVAIRAGPVENGRIPVFEGLRAGQRVVTEGAYELLYRDLKDLVSFVD